MPDPDSAAVARRNAAANGLARSTDPDELVAQIERTRENLAQTIDDLAERISPSNNLRKLRERARREAERPQVQLAIAAAGLLVVGYVVFRVLRRNK
jgi:ferric-dicitrate binding protein FerR (iron transport regulator)